MTGGGHLQNNSEILSKIQRNNDGGAAGVIPTEVIIEAGLDGVAKG